MVQESLKFEIPNESNMLKKGKENKKNKTNKKQQQKRKCIQPPNYFSLPTLYSPKTTK